MNMGMSMLAIPVFIKRKGTPTFNTGPKPIVTVPDRRGGMYRKLTVGDLLADYPNSYICKPTGAVIGQVRKVVTMKSLLQQGEVYFLLPKSFRPPSNWSWKEELARNSEVKGKQESMPLQSGVVLRLVSPREPAAFIVDYGPIILPNAPKASAPMVGSKPGTMWSLPARRSPGSQPWCPALETIREPQLTRLPLICKRKDNDFSCRLDTIEHIEQGSS